MLTLQFGQCGNQVGREFFSTVCADLNSTNVGISREDSRRYEEKVLERWFGTNDREGARPLRARAVLVDADAKVLRRVQEVGSTIQDWAYREGNTLCLGTAAGSGNNWAYGYNASANTAHFHEILTRAILGEIERLDRVEGFLFFLSCAGGTGSAVGCKALQLLRDEHPTKLIAAVVVLPWTRGEVTPQNYNAALTLPRFNEQADVVFLFENGRELAGGIEQDLRKSNAVVAETLAGLLQPIDGPAGNLESLLSAMLPHPSYKFPTIESYPGTAATITALPSAAKTCSVSEVLITRGVFPGGQWGSVDECRYAPWTNKRENCVCFYQKRRIHECNVYRTLSTNDSGIHRPLDAILRTAWNSYAYGAFLHKYKEFGVEDDDFLRAFARMENVARNYKELEGPQLAHSLSRSKR